MRHLLDNIGTCKLILEVSVSHGDSAISHPRDQDYLSLWVRKKGMRWSCSKRLAYMVANLFAKESEKRRQSTSRLFKLMGKEKRYEVELQQATSIYGG